jgi:hypothetical protein
MSVKIVGKRGMGVRVGLIEDQQLEALFHHGMNKTTGSVRSVGSEIIG